MHTFRYAIEHHNDSGCHLGTYRGRIETRERHTPLLAELMRTPSKVSSDLATTIIAEGDTFTFTQAEFE